ncbi:hypothetical protein [Pseudomonas sp. LRF_L74]|uniref:hypothetical protein n=1 Tax=Pseudomonas sp. LRF_L74 TaxID=3369422 RepID=UPI003F60EA2A
MKMDATDDRQRMKKLCNWGVLGGLGIGSALAWVLFEPQAKPVVTQVVQHGEHMLFGTPLRVQPTPSRALEGNDEDWIRTTEGQQAVQANREQQARGRPHDSQNQEQPASFEQPN